MNPAHQEVISAGASDRLDLFLASSARLGTAVQNVEKDFWVCWTLDALLTGWTPVGRACSSREVRPCQKHSVSSRDFRFCRNKRIVVG